MKYLKKFNNHSEYVSFLEAKNFLVPNVCLCDQEDDLHFMSSYDFSQDYLTFVALEDGTISFNIRFDMGTDMIKSISYSTDNGNTWVTTNNTDGKSEHLAITVSVNEGDKVMWKGDATQIGCWSPNEDVDDIVGSFFSSTCEFDAKGNVMSLLYEDDFNGKTTIKNEYAFASLFSDYDGRNTCGIVNAKNLSLPATTLASACYSYMFKGCTSLTVAPELPATTLVGSCYGGMFYGCTSLTTAPKLPATTLTSSCYGGMFYGCTSLTTAPELPSTTLASSCYMGMFEGCTSLTTAPELPATTLAMNCYYTMFQGCTSLTTAPELPAITLASHCYQSMFWGCKSLTTAPELPATTLADSCYWGMFSYCTNLTTAPSILLATTLASGCYDGMFRGCTSLTTAPELPATTLASYCYYHMFYGCTNLNSITCLATDISARDCTRDWVNGVASSGTFTRDEPMTSWTSGVNGIPNGWTVKNVHDYSQDYLTFVALEDGTFTFSRNALQYSLDNGTTWATLAANTASPTVTSGNKIMWKSELRPTSYVGIGTFSATGSFNAQGNVMSLLYGDDFKNQTDLSYKDYAFVNLFSGNTNVVSTENLVLPATTLANYCYNNMFQDCTSLTIAPALPATTLTDYCYESMFQGCTSLNSITCLATDLSASNCTGNWVNGVASSGTFTKAASMTSWRSGGNGIPDGWTTVDAS